MTVAELIKELKKYPQDAEVEHEHSESTCRGHPEGGYCYCSDEDVRNYINTVDLIKLKTNGKLLKSPKVILKGEKTYE